LKIYRRGDFLGYIKAFIIGGAICVVGQILIDKTKLTSARILVLFVVIGVILGGVGLYPRLVEFAGAGASVPLPGFGNLLAKGVMEEIDRAGFIGILTGGLKAAAAGIAAAVLFSFAAALVFEPKGK
jgi:stage V sporulation protein AE